MSSPAAAIPAPEYTSAQRWLITLTLAIGSIATILTSTIVNVTVPTIMGAFGVGQDQAQWLATGNVAAMTSSMLLADWFIRRLGRRATYVGSMVVFVAGSVIGGTANSYDMLILGRVLQGAAAGITQPLAMGTLFAIFPPGERGRAMGIFGMIIVLGPSIGPFVGGLTIDTFDWRTVFYVPLPVVVIASMMALVFIPGRGSDTRRMRFDWIGYALLVSFVMCLLVGLSNGPRDGWWSDSIVTLFALSGASFLGFIGWESWHREPLVNLHLFLHLRFVGAMIVSFIFGAGLLGTLYLVPIFVQVVQGYTPTKSGLMQIPAGMMMAVAMPITGRLVDRGLGQWLTVGGLLMAAYSGILMTGAHIDTAFWVFVGWVVMSRVGQSMMFTSLSTTSLQVLPPHLVGQAPGVANFIRSIGGAFGVNILAITVERQTQTYRQILMATQNTGNPETLVYLEKVRRLLEQAGLPDTVREPAGFYYLSDAILHQANMLAFRDAFMIYAIAMMVGLVPALFLNKGARRERPGRPGAAQQPAE